ncbi:MAG: CDP-alcohol phosphatidyltransferase family protein [Gammaproteobacteria bacterium]
MLDARLQPLIGIPLNWTGRWLARAGVSANTVTLCGTVVALGCVLAIARQDYVLGLALIALCRVLDGVDGAVARASHRTDLGGYLDIVSDYVFYAGVPLGFAIAVPVANALPAAALLASFLLTTSSFLAYATLAAKRGMTADPAREKSFFYSKGLMEGTETIAFFVAMALWPAHFATLAWVCAGLCVLTAIQRSATAFRHFR